MWTIQISGNRVELYRDGKKNSTLGFLYPEYKQFTMTAKSKMKDGKPFHWYQKWNAWGLNKDLLMALEALGIDMIVFKELNENEYYRASVADWKMGQEDVNGAYDRQVFLSDDKFLKTKVA
jgi:hypothetical protein